MRGKPGKYSHPLRQIVFLAAPPIEELDAVGPWEVFATANNALSAETRAAETRAAKTKPYVAY